ncbi:twin-arginine translocase TatA/TatE family subunit [Pseudomonas fluorescens]|uniref:Sec-independent protein translocase protein TatA n=1 Tax=Pseudomonas fluorescens TaxID=294 RepID=A0A327MS08_PSEFL|nr:twin-arginine translocase TatA/TatE family subunit [Pseudomonas fluorescens]RAI64734.1 twin-arginine translocase TatA/TatE family subunit [Pseudomonas fluorescens]
MGILDWKHWIVILVVVVLVFGTKKLKHLGADVGESIKGFRQAMNDDNKDTGHSAVQQANPTDAAPPITDGQPHKP